MLIDDVTIKVQAGKGGDGAVAFNKSKMSLGPTGGSGGQGGDVYLEGISNLNALNKFRFKKEFKAPNGGNGRGQFVDGKDGEDLVLPVPVGTVARNLDNNEVFEVVKIGERLLIAKGGKGGKGNFKFRSPVNTSPEEFQPGLSGQDFSFRLELKLIADVGFVGLPNVGKSSLLNELTNASAKVANYPFTTLEPNLGVYYDLILADIPGLIEGASGGKGLGDRFLRHIERKKILFHFVTANSPDPLADYETVRKELGEYNRELLTKKEHLFLSKSDAVKPEELQKIAGRFRERGLEPLPVSIYDFDSIEEVKKILNRLMEEKRYE